ncbi:transcription factor IIIB 50 kDa subunit [Platysternon megacephalum]|uniref:Transcription factor IIIB 50 kDa subunit n=1 Tax=Platysternon megacephalum TaxID=55544 RepID=A0A4D9EPD5_9SAUR|nr:transcription factor IIIB 50 kDa subunit [Platysternon megacephalum]
MRGSLPLPSPPEREPRPVRSGGLAGRMAASSRLRAYLASHQPPSSLPGGVCVGEGLFPPPASSEPLAPLKARPALGVQGQQESCSPTGWCSCLALRTCTEQPCH